MVSSTSSAAERRLFTGVFLALLAAHVALVFYRLQMPFLAGHEFRQTQTGLITYYIDKENNFSPFYEQPILGKPWVGFVLEFPLYEWSVVGLSRATGWEHFVAARVISIACFYLMLPALYSLLGRFGLARARRLLVLAPVLACPVYIFYTRAFLIDAMAFMFSAWFAAAFVRAMDRRSYGWLAAAAFAGSAAALVKSFIFAIWLWPTAAYGAWLLAQDLRPWRGWRPPLRTIAWGLGTVVVPLGLLQVWLAVTDPLKEAHASAWVFTSKNLSQGNWGLFRFGQLFSRSLWAELLGRWGEAIMHPWLLLALLAAGLVALPAARAKVAGLAGLFLLAQALFPFAYAGQDYYYYSCAVFAVGALGFLLLGLWDSRAPRWIFCLALMGVIGAEVKAYWDNYRPLQAFVAYGRLDFTENLKTMAPPDSVIVIAGHDWAPIIPYYTERRSLMIRKGLENDRAYLERAFRDLHDETVYALVAGLEVRDNRFFLDYAIKTLDLDPVPVFRSSIRGDVYVSRFFVEKALKFIDESRNRFHGDVTFPPRPSIVRRPMLVPYGIAAETFPMFTPAPHQIDFEFGHAKAKYEDAVVLTAHADSFVWVQPPAGAKEIELEFGLIDEAWKHAGERSNGVEFVVYGEIEAQARRRVLFRKLLDPLNVPADRPVQRARIDYVPQPGETLCFATLSNGSKTYDWAFWKRVDVR